MLSTSQAFALAHIGPERGSYFDSADEVKVFVRLGGVFWCSRKGGTDGYIRIHKVSVASIILALLGNVLSLPCSAQAVLRHCSNGTGTVVHPEVADQLVHPLS